MEARRQRDVKRGRERGVELIALNFDGRAQRFAASDIGGFMFAPVGLLAASLISFAPLPGSAEAAPGTVLRSSLAAPRLKRSHRVPRCRHGARTAMEPPGEVAHRPPGASPHPDAADVAKIRPLPLTIADGVYRQFAGEPDQKAPIPLLLLTKSLLI